jgi:hypothetical protein
LKERLPAENPGYVTRLVHQLEREGHLRGVDDTYCWTCEVSLCALPQQGRKAPRPAGTGDRQEAQERATGRREMQGEATGRQPHHQIPGACLPRRRRDPAPAAPLAPSEETAQKNPPGGILTPPALSGMFIMASCLCRASCRNFHRWLGGLRARPRRRWIGLRGGDTGMRRG